MAAPEVGKAPVPNYNDLGLVPATFAVGITFTVLSLVALLLRLYSRARYYRLAYEDGIATMAWCAALVTTFCACYITRGGIGKDMWDIRPGEFLNFGAFKGALVLNATSHSVAMTLTKIAILAFYARVFPFEGFKKLCYFIMVMVGATGLSCVLANVFACKPINALWTTPHPEGTKCIDADALFNATSVLLAVGDVIVLLLPLPTLYKTKMHPGKKLQVVGVLMVGLVATVCSIVRSYFMFSVPGSPNISRAVGDLNVTGNLEVHLGLLCSCAPAINVLLARRFSFFHSSNKAQMPDSQQDVYPLGGSRRTASAERKHPSPFGDDTLLGQEDENMPMGDRKFFSSHSVDTV